jgi:hypothetical protein
MKKLLAIIFVVTISMAAGLAQIAMRGESGNADNGPDHAAYVNKASVEKDAKQLKLTADISVSGATTGNVPMFTDTTGDLGGSLIFQSGSNVGIGTKTPASVLNAVSGVSDFRWNTGAAGLTPTISVLSTTGKAGAILAGTNGTEFTFDSAGWFSISTDSHAKFLNNGLGQGPQLLTVLPNGNVGVGTNAPAYPLSVGGVIQSSTGGFMFPDGTTQKTATLVGPVGPQGPAGATGAQGPVGPAGATGPAGGGGLTVKDANGNALGTLLSIGGVSGSDVTIYTKGYFVTLGVSGVFPVGSQLPSFPAIYWSGASCNGSPYLLSNGSGSTTYTKTVIYSAQANELLVPAGSGTTALASSISFGSIEFPGPSSGGYADGASQCIVSEEAPYHTGWLLEIIEPATLGWTVVANSNPLSVAGPLQLP